MNFGEVLKELRAERGITQEKLARDLDIPESSIRRLETSDGVPRKERIKQIAAYFGVSTDRLLGSETKENSSIEETQAEKEQNEILRLVIGITDPVKKQAAIEVLKGLAGGK